MPLALALFVFAIGVAYWPGLDGASTSLRAALIAGGLWIFLRPTALTATHAAMVALISWCAITFLWTPFPWDWVNAMAQMLMIGGAFWAGSSCEDLRPVYVAVGLAVAISSMIAIIQVLFPGAIPDAIIAQSASPGGLFVNKNLLAETAAMALAGVLTLRTAWLIPMILPSLILPLARGPALGALAAIATILPRWVTVLVLGAVGALMWLRGTTDMTIRVEYWRATIDGLSVFGNGAGSFYGLFPTFAPRITSDEIPVNAHGDFLQLAFDTGALGAACAVAIIAISLRGDDPRARAVLVAFLVEGLVGFPLYQAPTAFLAALVAGYLCRGRLVLWRPLALRGA